MALPTYFGAGAAAAANAAAISPAWPAGHQADDIGVLIVGVGGGAAAPAAPAGWTEFPDSPQIGNDATILANRLSMFWKLATGGAEAAPSITPSAGYIIGRIHVIRGCATSGDPFNATNGDGQNTSDTTVEIPGDTTTVADCLIFAACGAGIDTSSAQFSAWANADLANVTERDDSFTSLGNGGGFGAATGEKATAGAFGTTTATLAASSPQPRIVIAFRPPPPGGGTEVDGPTLDLVWDVRAAAERKVRLVSDIDGPDAHAHLDYFFVGGQSNAAGLGVAAEAPVVPAGDGLEYVNPITTFRHLEEPVGLAANPPSTGSAWSAFGVRYSQLMPRQPVIHGRAVGGTSQTIEASDFAGNDAWTAIGGLKFSQAVTEINGALAQFAARGVPHTFRGILWDQGGKDAIAIDDGVPGVTKALYKQELVAMIAAFRAEFGAELPFFIFRLGREAAGDTAGWQQVRAAQEEVAADDPFTFIVFDRALFFPDEGKMRDEFHYTQPGYNEMGTLGAEGVVAALEELEGPAEGPAAGGIIRKPIEQLPSGVEGPALRLVWDVEAAADDGGVAQRLSSRADAPPESPRAPRPVRRVGRVPGPGDSFEPNIGPPDPLPPPRRRRVGAPPLKVVWNVARPVDGRPLGLRWDVRAVPTPEEDLRDLIALSLLARQ